MEFNEKQAREICMIKVMKFIKPKDNEIFDKQNIEETIYEEIHSFFWDKETMDEKTLRKKIMDFIEYGIYLTFKMRVYNKILKTKIPIAKKDENLIVIYDYKKDKLSYIENEDFPNEWETIVKVFKVNYNCNKEICRDCGKDCPYRDNYESSKYRECYDNFIDWRTFEDDLWEFEIREQINVEDFEWDKLWG